MINTDPVLPIRYDVFMVLAWFGVPREMANRFSFFPYISEARHQELLNAQHASYAEKLAEETRRSLALGEQVSAKLESISGLVSELEISRRDLANLEAHLDEWRTHALAQRQALEKSADTIAEVNAVARHAQMDLRKKNIKYETLERKLQAKYEALEVAKTALAATEAERNHLRDTLAATQADLDAAQIFKTTQSSEIAQLQTALADSLNCLKDAASRETTRLATVIAENASQAQIIESLLAGRKRDERRIAFLRQVSATGNEPYVTRLARTKAELRTAGVRQALAKTLMSDGSGAPARKALFTLHKTASMFVWQLFDYLGDLLNINLYSPNGTGSEYIYDEINIKEKMGEIDWPPGLYGPFRGAFDFDSNLFDKTVIVLRDPRDILTSMFYSWSYSHPVADDVPTLVGPQGQLFNPTYEERQGWIERGIDAFVLEYSNFVAGNLRAYIDRIIPQQHAHVLFYEEFIASPQDWIIKLLEAFGCESEHSEILAEYAMTDLAEQFTPITENPINHRRQMTPGDYKRKLQPETIMALDVKFDFYSRYIADKFSDRSLP